MPTAATETQIGTAYINGIGGSITMNAGNWGNLASVESGDNFKTDEIVSQNGAVIETVIASQQYKEFTMEFAPSNTTSRALARSAAASFVAIGALAVVTVANCDIAVYNGTYNYMGGASIKSTRDGVTVCNMKLRKYVTAADGASYAALSPIT